jgi:hypothetical protein
MPNLIDWTRKIISKPNMEKKFRLISEGFEDG